MTMSYKGFTFLQILLIIIGITLTVAFISAMAINIYNTNNTAQEIISEDTVRKISSDGEQIWKFSGHSDMVSSVHVDNQGNVYSRSGWIFENEIRKLNKDGQEVWGIDVVGEAKIETVDDQGIIYTKSSDGILQKIDHEGQEVWNIDVGEAKIETVDDQGNVYSRLDNDTLQKINNDGKKTWTLKKRGEYINLVDIDSQGNVYIRVDNSIQKINRSGQVVWSFEEDSSKEIKSIKVDPQGNMYSHIDNGPIRSVNSDFFYSTIRKITPQGEEEWAVNYPDYMNSYSWKIDDQGNIYITSGWTDFKENNRGRKISKDGQEGQEVWNIDIGEARIKTVDDQGNVYATDADSGEVKKIDSNGRKLWEFDSGSNISSIRVNQGNIYIAAGHDVWKINSEGGKEWKFDGNVDSINTIAIDKQGNVYTGSGENDRLDRNL